MKLSRRAFIRLGVLGALAAAGGKGFYNSRRPELVEVEVRLKRLPPALDGMRIGQITDVHAGPLVPASLTKRGVDLIMNRKPDLVVLTGDFVSGATRFLWTTYGGFKEKHLTALLEEFKRLEAPLGVYGVLGNHDFWSGPRVAARIADSLTGIGVRLLRNESVRLTPGEDLYLSGVDDYWESSYNLKDAVKNVPDGAGHILLSHNPDVNEDVDTQNRPVDLIISGHTHGGQVVMPVIGAPFLPSSFGQKYRMGLVPDGPRQTYISRGLGIFFVPVRINCPPDVSLITLRSR